MTDTNANITYEYKPVWVRMPDGSYHAMNIVGPYLVDLVEPQGGGQLWPIDLFPFEIIEVSKAVA